MQTTPLKVSLHPASLPYCFLIKFPALTVPCCVDAVRMYRIVVKMHMENDRFGTAAKDWKGSSLSSHISISYNLLIIVLCVGKIRNSKNGGKGWK